MKNIFGFLILFILYGIFCSNTSAQLSAKYTFSNVGQTSVVYISGATSLGSAASDAIVANVPIGFNFTFNCQNYTTVGVSSNGFIWFGSGSVSANQYTPLSSQAGESGSVEGIITAFAKNITSVGSWSYVTTGVAPNRKFTVEWKNAQPVAGGIDMQITLNENGGTLSNQIEIAYQDKPYLISGTATGQTGIRSNTIGDFMNRKAPDWCVSTPAGTVNTDVSSVNGTTNCTGYPGNTKWKYTYSGTSCCVQPSNEASSFNYSNVNAGAGTADISFQRGSGTGGVIVIGRDGATPGFPVNNTIYSGANSAYGSGTALGGGYLLYASTVAGDNTSVINISLSGLSGGHSYFFSVYEYNGTGCYSVNTLSGSFCIGTPPQATVTPSASTVCAGSRVNLSLTGLPPYAGFTYKWKVSSVSGSGYVNPGTGTVSSTYLTPASLPYNPSYYICQVTCPTGGNTKNSTEASVTDNALPSPSITASSPTTLCVKDSVILQANTGAGLTYKWKKGTAIITGATSAIYVAKATGNYTVIETNSTGCSASSSIYVTVKSLPAAAILAGGPTTFCDGDSVVLTSIGGSGLTYQWILGSTNIAGATKQNYSAKLAGSYKVTVTNSAGCSKTSAIVKITVNCRLEEKMIRDKDFSIYPNPANNLISIRFNSSVGENATVKLTDVQGRIVKSLEVEKDFSELEINVSDLAEGVYFVHLKYGDTFKVVKTIISR